MHGVNRQWQRIGLEEPADGGIVRPGLHLHEPAEVGPGPRTHDPASA